MLTDKEAKARGNQNTKMVFIRRKEDFNWINEVREREVINLIYSSDYSVRRGNKYIKS